MSTDDGNENPPTGGEGEGPSLEGGPSPSEPETPPNEPALSPEPAPPRRAADFFSNSPWAKQLRDKAQNFDWAGASEAVTRAFQKRGGNFYGKLATIILCTYFLSDFLALVIGSRIPEPPAARGPSPFEHRRPRTIDDYGVVFTRNLFNSKGIIPGEEGPGAGFHDQGGAPVRTTLPFNLVGTVILEDPTMSIAIIEDKSAQNVYPTRVDDEIPGKARIVSIEPKKVIFVNLASGRREFVDLPEEPETTHVAVAAPQGPGIEQLSATQFNISRSEVDKAIGNLSQVLTQARAIPNFKNGVPDGYKLIQIVPDSIYAKLGLKDGDVLDSLNGDPINDPAKALALLQSLRDQSHMELGVERDGRQSTYAYDIR